MHFGQGPPGPRVSRQEPVIDAAHVANAVLHMANLPLDVNDQFITIMATRMPFVGRG